MAYQVIKLTCPGCGYPITIDTKICPKCKRPIEISTFNSLSSWSVPLFTRWLNQISPAFPDHTTVNLGLAFCHLKLKRYDVAESYFEKAIEDNFDNSEIYFYAAVCKLKGKMAFLAERAKIKAIENLIESALMIEPKGIYHYFRAYIKYDFYERKKFNTKPHYTECLQQAVDAGLSDFDIAQLYDILGVERPAAL